MFCQIFDNFQCYRMFICKRNTMELILCNYVILLQLTLGKFMQVQLPTTKVIVFLLLVSIHAIYVHKTQRT